MILAAFFWSAPAERSGDGALDIPSRPRQRNDPKRRRRFTLPAHSKYSGNKMRSESVIDVACLF
jgi:hypothetical protein